jgi:hypothetical protein
MKEITRRRLLTLAGLGLGSAVLAACGPEQSARSTETAVPPTVAPSATPDKVLTAISEQGDKSVKAIEKLAEVLKPAARVDVTPVSTVPAKPAAESTKSAVPGTPEASADLGNFLKEFRNKILTMDETKVEWDKGGEQEGGVPYMDKRGVLLTELRINTGARDYEMVTGGKYEFLGSAVEGLGTKAAAESSEGKESVTDPVSGGVLFYRDGERLVIPGGTDSLLRGNILFILGDKADNRSAYFLADTASNFRQKRMSGRHNGTEKTLSTTTRDVMAAMGRVYAESMYNGNNCKGNGCKDQVGVYILRAGDKATGAGIEILAAVVLKGDEMKNIKLKKQV